MSGKYENNRKKDSRLQKIYGSQNFLTSKKLLERIVRKSTITKNDTVIEIGTGKGHLTEVLCKRAGYVYTAEIDRKLYKHAKERLKNVNNLKITCEDFMKCHLPDKGNYKVFSNIPYYLTTGIIKKLTENPNPPIEMWLVMEKGAAKRFLGTPAETKYSLYLKYKWKLNIAYFFKKEDFHPKPSVDSVLLHFLRK